MSNTCTALLDVSYCMSDMTNSDRTPIFNLKAVVQETGLKPDTLRAWERRYGLPTPQRTDSGHRLYSQHDIDVVKWLVERQEEGLTIRRAVDLWHQLELEQGDPLAAQEQADVAPVLTPPARSSIDVQGESTNVSELRREWVHACLQFDEQRADHALSQAFALFSTETVCSHIMQRGLAEIGEGWHSGRVTAQQEHFASALAIRRLEAMLAGTPAPYRNGRIIVGCPPEEEHTFIPVMLSLLLRRHGFDVVYLGANIPLRSVEATVAAAKPKLVVLAAQQLFTAANLLEMAYLLEEEQIPLAYGGLVFRNLPELAKVIPGYYLGDQLDSSLQAIEQIMLNPKVHRAVRQRPAAYAEAHDYFRRHQADIEASLWRGLAEIGIPHRRLDAANAIFGRNIRAALLLGDMNFLGPDLDWIENLLVNHFQMPADMLDRYLEMYFEAARDNLDERGDIVVAWLAGVVGVQLDRARAQRLRERQIR